ncbi:MAG TPA: GDSL-type esterase/lipase family protein [Arachnia sp.]|nr:GDSL-type esterase/lipase family protein [Arachnia sp.]
MKRLFALVMLVGLAVSLGVASPALADDTDPGPLVVVFDTSGSMTDKGPDGVVKLSAAKKSMSDMVYSVNGSAQGLGLWTYPGGESRDGCPAGKWVNNLSPDQKPDATNVQAQIGLLGASGGTPTGPALRAVVDSLKAGKTNAATIVLVSDGEANCGPPACEVAKEVIASGFALTVAAVAFDIAGDSGRADLECAAYATGGSYSTAQDTSQLIDELAKYQYKGLELSVEAPKVVRAGEVMQVTATVHNPSRTAVREATLLLRIEGMTSITGQVQAPQRRLPAIEPGASVTRTWVIATNSSARGQQRWSVLAGSKDGSVRETGAVTFTDKHLTRADAGELLADHGGTVLVLGDSYSSGEGTADYVKGDYTSPDGRIRCHRSMRAYGGVIGGEVTKVIACSGAVSGDLGSVIVGDDTQFGLLLRETKPDVVLLTIGGNDIGFADIVEQCFLGDCSKDVQSYLARIEGHAGWSALYSRVSSFVNQPEQLERRSGAPVPIVVSPYPDPLWDASRGYCGTGGIAVDILRKELNKHLGYAGLDIGFSPRDIVAGKKILAALNAKIEASVAEAQSLGVPSYYPAPVTNFAFGHSSCEKDTYFVALDLGSAALRAHDPAKKSELFHPNRKGHVAWADALITWSQSASAKDVLTDAASKPVRESLWPRLWSSAWNTIKPLMPALQPPSQNLTYPSSGDAVWSASGSKISLKLDSLAPWSGVLVTARSTPVTIGRIEVGEDGVASGTVTLPELSSGSHQLILEGYNENYELVGAVVPLQVWSGFPWVLVGAAVLCWATGLTALIAWAVAKGRCRAARGEAEL